MKSQFSDVRKDAVTGGEQWERRFDAFGVDFTQCSPAETSAIGHGHNIPASASASSPTDTGFAPQIQPIVILEFSTQRRWRG